MCIGSQEPHCRTVLQNGQNKPWKHFPSLSWNTRQGFLNILSYWEAALETEQRCLSKVILESNVTPNLTSLSDSFSTVPPMVNGGDWGRIMCDLETIIVLVLLTFNFIPQRLHHLLTLPRSWIRDYATVTLMPGDGTTATKVVISITDLLIFQNRKKLRSAQEEQ